jgi:hypothetical protein
MTTPPQQRWTTLPADRRLAKILRLVDEGVLGRELCPTEDYWHWPVIQPEKLPSGLRRVYKIYGEVRWHGMDY